MEAFVKKDRENEEDEVEYKENEEAEIVIDKPEDQASDTKI